MRGRADHADKCRKCGVMHIQSEMVSASKVLKRGNARGWFCKVCAYRQENLSSWLKGMGTANAPKPRRHD